MLPGRRSVEGERSKSLADATAKLGLLPGLRTAAHIIGVLSHGIFAAARQNIVVNFRSRPGSIGSASYPTSA
jgi:hypothetical protein